MRKKATKAPWECDRCRRGIDDLDHANSIWCANMPLGTDTRHVYCTRKKCRKEFEAKEVEIVLMGYKSQEAWYRNFLAKNVRHVSMHPLTERQQEDLW